jgi:GntR family transcriptional repressor for pyruvate dehydrogenase complex
MRSNEVDASRSKTSAVGAVINYVEKIIGDEASKVDRLPSEPEIAQIVGVSRTPVREAMKILNAIGVIEIRRGVGTFIRPHARSALGYLLMFETAIQAVTPEQLFEARLMIEQTTAELASIRGTPEDIQRMHEANSELRRLAEAKDPDLDLVTEADIAFHKAVFDSCGNPLIAAIGKLTIEQVRPWVRLTNQDNGPMKSVKIHENMISAIENQNIAEARQSTALRAVRDGLADWHSRLLKA